MYTFRFTLLAVVLWAASVAQASSPPERSAEPPRGYYISHPTGSFSVGGPWWRYQSPCSKIDTVPNGVDRSEYLRDAFACRQQNLERARQRGRLEEAIVLSEIGRAQIFAFWTESEAREQGLETLASAQEIAEELDEPCLHAFLWLQIAVAQGKGRKEYENYRQAVAIAQQGGCRSEEAVGFIGLGVSHRRGSPEGIAAYEEGLSIAREIQDEAMILRALRDLAFLYSESGDPKAIQYGTELVEMHRAREEFRKESNATWNLGVFYLRLGLLEESLPYLSAYIEKQEEWRRKGSVKSARAVLEDVLAYLE